jgi:hypothetical protein
VFKLVFAVCGAALALGLSPADAYAHGGGLNAQGCHNDRKNNSYHCHRGGGGPASAPAPRRRQQTLSSGGPVHFANCSEARAAGAAPLRRGEPGYRPAMDRDNDGVACE